MREFFDGNDWDRFTDLLLKYDALLVLLFKGMSWIAKRFQRRPSGHELSGSAVLTLSGTVSARATVLPAHLAAISGETGPVWFPGIGDKP